MHSAAWNQKLVSISCYRKMSNYYSYDFENKRIGIIGGGSSSIQIVPNLQKVKGTKLTCFVRSRTWISNPFGDRKFMDRALIIVLLTRTRGNAEAWSRSSTT